MLSGAGDGIFDPSAFQQSEGVALETELEVVDGGGEDEGGVDRDRLELEDGEREEVGGIVGGRLELVGRLLVVILMLEETAPGAVGVFIFPELFPGSLLFPFSSGLLALFFFLLSSGDDFETFCCEEAQALS